MDARRIDPNTRLGDSPRSERGKLHVWRCRAGLWACVVVAAMCGVSRPLWAQQNPPPDPYADPNGSAAQAVSTPLPGEGAGSGQPVARRLSLSPDPGDPLVAERGHAEFDLGMRRFYWQDPMARLEYALAREQWAARRGGMVIGIPAAVGFNVSMAEGVSPRLILSGPFAPDWHTLTRAEKIGRIAEGVAYAGLLVGLVNWLADGAPHPHGARHRR